MNAPNDTPVLGTADIVLTVIVFRELPNPATWWNKELAPDKQTLLTEVKMDMPNPQFGWVWKKASGEVRGQDAIRVQTPGAVLRYRILPNTDDRDPYGYYPVGACFSRLDKVTPRMTPITQAPHPASPFSGLILNGSQLQFTVVPVHGVKDAKGSYPSYITYKLWIMIQRAHDGAIGIIDPWDEIENPP
jgi:hypothetical protein